MNNEFSDEQEELYSMIINNCAAKQTLDNLKQGLKILELRLKGSSDFPEAERDFIQRMFGINWDYKRHSEKAETYAVVSYTNKSRGFEVSACFAISNENGYVNTIPLC